MGTFSEKHVERRAYHSELRAARAAETQAKIQDALLAVMARDPTGFSIPAVAQEAGVSVPTVYRYYPNKVALLEAARARGDRILRVEERPRGPQSVETMTAYLRRFFGRFARLPPNLRALARSPALRELRAHRREARTGYVEETLEQQLQRLPPKERVMARDVIAVLASSAALDAFEEYLGLGPDAAADRVEWVMKKLLDEPRSPRRRRRNPPQEGR